MKAVFLASEHLKRSFLGSDGLALSGRSMASERRNSEDDELVRSQINFCWRGGASSAGGRGQSLHQSSSVPSSYTRPYRPGGGPDRWRIVDLISTGRRLRKNSVGQCITKGICDALPDGISRRSSVHREQINNIEHLGAGFCDHRFCWDCRSPGWRLNGVRKN